MLLEALVVPPRNAVAGIRDVLGPLRSERWREVVAGFMRHVAGPGLPAEARERVVSSWLVARGLPTRLVADFLGTGEQMILSHYGHLAPDYQLVAALAIASKGVVVGETVGAGVKPNRRKLATPRETLVGRAGLEPATRPL